MISYYLSAKNSEYNADGIPLLTADVETITVCFVARFLGIDSKSFIFVHPNYCPDDEQVSLVGPKEKCIVPFLSKSYLKNCEFLGKNEVNTGIEGCWLPFAKDTKLGICYSGLGSICRLLVKSKKQFHYLLGQYGNCLKSCAEASKWTELCENRLIKVIETYLGNSADVDKELLLCEALNELEVNLSLTPVVSNVNKRRKEAKNGSLKSLTGDVTVDVLDIHPYLEGLDFLLTDLIVCSYLNIILNFNETFYQHLKEKLIRLNTWFSRVMSNTDVQQAAVDVFGKFSVVKMTSFELYATIPCTDKQIIKPKISYKPTVQCIEKIFTKLSNSSFILLSNISLKLQEPYILPANLLMEQFLLIKEILPSSRFERKCHQLRNMINPIALLAMNWSGNRSCRIVDFCSGSGHLGILLGRLLPECHVTLVENKEESLIRGLKILNRDLVSELARKNQNNHNLSESEESKNQSSQKDPVKSDQNIEIHQCNLNRFQINFDIGVCLHGCGLVTDLVLQKCYRKRALFVICPCCYGGIKDNNNSSYPISASLKQVISHNEYLNIAHAADQSEVGIKQYDLAKKCMTAVDTDRLLGAQSRDYKTWMFTMDPELCTPKNNILVGIPTENPLCKIFDGIVRSLEMGVSE